MKTRINKTIWFVFLGLLLTLPAVIFAKSTPMGTFSIVAFDPQTGELGVAVQSKVYHVGMIVAWAEAGAGAVATQSLSNKSFGPQGLELMKAGLSAEETLDWLLKHDPERENRQVGIVDHLGKIAHHTGSKCMSWAGHIGGTNFTVQGNILAGEKVVTSMVDAFHTTDGELGRRLLAALQAGQDAGGDKRGRQSAAILVVRPSKEFPEYNYRYIDLRVEDHETPIKELIRLFNVYEGTTLAEAHIKFAAIFKQQGLLKQHKLEITRLGQSLERLLNDTSADAYALNALAWYTAVNDMFLDKAMIAAKRAVQLEPTNYEILDTLAEVYYRLGQNEKAIATGKKALEIKPDDPYLKEQLQKFQKKCDCPE